MAKERVHYVVVRVVFDKPIPRVEAVAEFKDCIYGEFYPSAYLNAEKFRIAGVKSAAIAKAKGE